VSADQRQWSLVRGRNLSDVVLVTNRPDQ